MIGNEQREDKRMKRFELYRDKERRKVNTASPFDRGTKREVGRERGKKEKRVKVVREEGKDGSRCD